MRRAAALAFLVAAAGAALAATFPPAAGPAGDPVRDAEPDGLLLLAVLSPERAMAADPRTGATSARELPGGTLCHGPLLAVGRRVVYVGSRKGRFVALSAPLGRPGRARSLGRADTMAASPTPGRLWLGRAIRLGRDAERIALREVDARGRVVARDVLPEWAMLDGVVGDGLLITRGSRIVLRRPQRPPRRIGAGWLFAAGASRVAWCKGGCRRVRIWSEAGEQTLDTPAGLRPDQAGRPAFSPDGERLALPVSTPGGSRVAVIDLELGEWSVLPGARIGGYKAIAWSPSGRWLYFTGRGDRLLAARGGVERPVRLPVRTGGPVMSIASRPGSAGP
jgi:hypothetical protein